MLLNVLLSSALTLALFMQRSFLLLFTDEFEHALLIFALFPRLLKHPSLLRLNPPNLFFKSLTLHLLLLLSLFRLR
jgi:hypothetical protein